MGLFDGIEEVSLIEKLLDKNKISNGEKVYFSNLIYTDELDKEFEILYIYKNPFSAYSGLVVNINDKEVRLIHEPLPIVTLVYLRMQKLSIEYNNK